MNEKDKEGERGRKRDDVDDEERFWGLCKNGGEHREKKWLDKPNLFNGGFYNLNCVFQVGVFLFLANKKTSLRNKKTKGENMSLSV